MNARASSGSGGRSVALYAALGTVVAAVAVALLVSLALGAAVLLLGAAASFLLSRRGARAPKVELFYNLDAEAEARFLGVREACEALAGSEQIWRAGDEGAEDGGVAPVGPRADASVGLLKTSDFSANVDVWGIESDGVRLFFLPECVLLHRDGRYRPISYDSFGVTYGQSRRTEDGPVPSDAEVVGKAGSFAGKNGGRRSLGGAENPVVAYGGLVLTGLGEGEPIRLLVSNKARAVRFARPFGVGKEEAQGDREARTAREARARRNAEAEAEKNGALYKILGVEPGASQAEIHSAYKKKARMYHPDRVAAMDPEVREMAELRMKEINAAYGEIKRRKASPEAR